MDRQLRIQKLTELQTNSTPKYQEYIVYKSNKELKPVYEIPLDFLVYNKYNGRILSMVKSFEKEKHTLIAENPNDKKTIEEFLWESKIDRNKTTMKDLKDWGQKKFGIVTKDGIIIDGNRRAFLLNKIAKDENSAPTYFLAIILPDTIEDNAKEIMKLETTYQMGEDEKLDYNPIEKYLKCDDLKALGFTSEEIARMMGENKSKVDEWLEIKKVMDDYLNSLGYDGIYTRLERREGQFVDLNNYLNKYKNGTYLATWNYQDSDVSDLKAICFDYIRAQYEGKEFRAIAKPSRKESFFCHQNVWEQFRDRHFEKIEDINNQEGSVDSLRQENPDGNLSKLLKQRDVEWLEETHGLLQGHLNISQRNLDDILDQNAPRELLQRAKNTLQSINTESETFYTDPEVLLLVKEINHLTYEFKKLLEHN